MKQNGTNCFVFVLEREIYNFFSKIIILCVQSWFGKLYNIILSDFLQKHEINSIYITKIFQIYH